MIAINDVMREITFCKKASLQIIGIIENMSGYVCPNCKVRHKDKTYFILFSNAFSYNLFVTNI